ncbi:3D domain protein [Sulfobacillus acidophilus TPY]|uniref:3D domain-containing protein n=1 Tax=Sulfobacillus acidophilus (strain ATCC 700253 / DSM 10332 / NAL) TaxID=679936 RepID=G8TYX1_SULAD|nr:3D domain protein [Sulfobacillus acidophilus TPY]AEW05150.1 3D domain-containing protein [Sulfobacillus acidophilus DSM 10332]
MKISPLWAAGTASMVLALSQAPAFAASAATLPSITLTASGTWVSVLQSDLNRLGYQAGPVTGTMNSQTVQALTAFETSHQLSSGDVSSQVWSNLVGVINPASGWPKATQSLMAQHPAMRQVLAPGATGSWVMTLQADLQDLGYSEVGPVDGIFGPKTEAALEAFQKAAGLPVTGITNPATWQDILAGFGLTPPFLGNIPVSGWPLPTVALAMVHPAMRQVLAPGATGSWVMTLQADLQALGYSEVGPVDGIFGPKTEAALEAFQRAAGLPVTGVTNPATWQDILASFHLMPAYNTGVASESVWANNASASTASSSLSAATIDGRPVLRVLHMIATAYGPSLQDNYPYGPVDAFGQPLAPGMVAVDPTVIPLKTWLYVTGYTDPDLPAGGFLGQAMDTGGAIKGMRIDIFMNANPTTVSNFGIEPVTVYVLGN